MSTPQSPDAVRETVRTAYDAVARTSSSCCAPTCCAPSDLAEALDGVDPKEVAQALGYSEADLAAVPDGANLGLGCGNPQAIAALSPGETVLDLGSGPGFDCLLAGRAVGPEGKVIGVDMTPSMLERARASASEAGLDHVEFRLGTIEHLPVADRSVDVILSNCVVNLSPEKRAVFSEAFRVLRPGGRLAIKDILAIGEIPPDLAGDFVALTGCVAGAVPVAEIQQLLSEVGFTDVVVDIDASSRELIDSWMPGRGAGDVVASASIQARRPETA